MGVIAKDRPKAIRNEHKKRKDTTAAFNKSSKSYSSFVSTQQE